MLCVLKYTLNLVHIKVPQGRQDLEETGLTLGGPRTNGEDPQHPAAVDTVDVPDGREVERVLEQGRLYPEEVDLQPPVRLQGKKLAHEVDELLGPLPLEDELHKDEVTHLEK